MNDDWYELLKKYVFEQTYGKTYSWDYRADDLVDQLYKLSKEPELPYYSRHDDTKDREVAKAALEALESGLTLDQLLEKNAKVRSWWGNSLKEREAARVRAEREKERRRKAAEKKKIEDAKRAEAAAKLTPEELVAFGLNAKGYHKR